MLKIDFFRLFQYDRSLLEEETARWAEESTPGQPADNSLAAVDMAVCACRRHPSGALRDPRESCMNCHGTGIPSSNEVHKYVFDGKGNFSEVNPRAVDPNDKGPDDAKLIKFR